MTVTAVELDPRWMITGHLNGGYLTAVMGRAASERFGGAAPLTISAHFLAPARSGGPAEVEVDVVREGRLSSARVRLIRDGLVLVDGVVTVGTPRASDVLLEHAARPELPGWDACPDAGAGMEAVPGMELLRHVELRPHPDDAAAISGGAAQPRARMRSWFAYRDVPEVDDILLMAGWDALPPAPWAAHVWGQLPTVSAQVVLYPGEAVGPLLVEARCDTLRDGIVDETARVWDSTGRLVSSARQTAVHIPA